MAFSMIFTADIVPTESNCEVFSSGKMEEIIDNNILNYLASADFRFMNLEVPLTDVKKPISKCGPNLIAPVSTVKGLKALNPTVLGLCNNHTLDQDEQGLFSTMDVLKANNIDFTGVGKDLSEAWKPYIYEKDGVKVGIYSCAEHEFTIASDNSWGANPFDPLESLDHIANLKKECDYVVVIYHGGKEHYRFPSPKLKKTMHKMIEKGADFVTCQHTHCISCIEEYKGGTILYGQGNFLFDLLNAEPWQTALVVKLTIDNGIKPEYYPVHKDGEKVRKPTKAEEKEIMDGFYLRTEQIKDDEFVKKSYSEFCKLLAPAYFSRLLGFSPEEIKKDVELGGANSLKKLSLNQLMCFRNYHECEPHVELVLTAINDRAKELQ